MAATGAGDRPPAIFIMGPTAAGKTDVAVALADHLPVEIISVDSALVYKGMDIGTAKPDAGTLARVRHHLIDIRDPADPYTAADFVADAEILMTEIRARGRIPVLAGGTMLYFRLLREGLSNLPSTDPAVREAIDREASRHGWPSLHRQLAQVDPETAGALHPNHSQRIQRALEIYRITGRPASALKAENRHRQTVCDRYQVVQIALIPGNRKRLHERIEKRFWHMLEKGLLDEVQQLRDRGDLHTGLPAIRAVGYRQVWGYLAGEYGHDEMVARGVAATRQLAKRQLTWLRSWPGVERVSVDDGEGGNWLDSGEIVTKCLKILENSPIY